MCVCARVHVLVCVCVGGTQRGRWNCKESDDSRLIRERVFFSHYSGGIQGHTDKCKEDLIVILSNPQVLSTTCLFPVSHQITLKLLLWFSFTDSLLWNAFAFSFRHIDVLFMKANCYSCLQHHLYFIFQRSNIPEPSWRDPQ